MTQNSADTDFSDFGATTRGRRLELGMTQEQVAEQVGVKPNYIGYLERGLRKPSDEICCRIADALGIDRKDLFFLANPHVRAIVRPPDAPTQSAWDVFRRDRQLHTRQSITDDEMRVLERVGLLGEVKEPRDYLFILAAIRQSLSRG